MTGLPTEEAFPGQSQMAELMRAKDWRVHPLGDPSSWPDELKVPLRMMLTSRFEMWLGWGEELFFFYNDAYLPTLGMKHPNALGRPMREVWSEIFESVRDRVSSVMNDGIATWDKALMLLLERNGYPEETYHTFSYSPLRAGSGPVRGLMCVVNEETERVISERWLDTLRTLSASLVPARTRPEILSAARSALASNIYDFPFSIVHIFAEGTTNELEAKWPLEGVKQGKTTKISLRDSTFLTLTGRWNIPPSEALLSPIATRAGDNPQGVLILGTNPYQSKTRDIQGFAELLAGQIGAAIGAADAAKFEAEETERLRELFAQSPSFMAVLRGPDHRYELINQSYSELVNGRDVLGKTVGEALPEIEGQGFIELLDQVYRTGQSYTGHSAPLTIVKAGSADPQDVFVDFVYQPVRNAAGEVTGIFVEGFDVTATRQAIAALRKSESEFRTLAEVMPNQVWTATADGSLDWFNSGVLVYSGLAAEQLQGSGWARMVHPSDLPAAFERWTQALASGEPYEAEFRLLRSDRTYRWHIARAVSIRDGKGDIIRWIGTNTDIEEQKTTSEALHELNATLEQQVQTRTGELMAAEEALRQSQKMEALGHLTGGIAHDFNNLLTGIIGSLDLIRRRLDAGRHEDIERFMSAASTSAKRAAALTHRLLAFARRQPLDTKPQDVNAVIAGLEDLLRRTTGEGTELRMELGASLWPALTDANQLENSLINLAINARDAMPNGGSVTISTANETLSYKDSRLNDSLRPGNYVVVTVSDTGEGMSDAVRAKAFDPFFTTKPIGQGTGLGLSMIYGFLGQSGGGIHIDSKVGMGTSVFLFFRRAEAGASGELSEVEPAVPRGKGETILVVEDDAAVRQLITQVLDELDYNYLEAMDGQSAIPLLQSPKEIALLITDVGLPFINGRQVAEIGRKHRPHLKVLYITGYAEQALARKSFLDRGMEMMTKPFDLDALARKIRDLIEGSSTV